MIGACDVFSASQLSDAECIIVAKETLHVSTEPSRVVCREKEQEMVFNFCKACIERDASGSLYICGCPGTGKSLAVEKVKQNVIDWAKMENLHPPDSVFINCTSLPNPSEIFNKIITKYIMDMNTYPSLSPLELLKNLYSHPQQTLITKMMLIFVDELDYLITKDRNVIQDLFMLTTLPFSSLILIGISNAIDLTDRFLPRLHLLNCKPLVITFKAYTQDQIIKILHDRLKGLTPTVFHPQALELCARKVAAASGDMRKVLAICRSALEILEADLRNGEMDPNPHPTEKELDNKDAAAKRATVMIDHMHAALSKAYGSTIVETIQSLPQHQQMILCSAVKLFHGGKKDASVGELHKIYLDVCQSTMIPACSFLEFSSMLSVLNDQGLIKVGESRDDRLKRVTLKGDTEEIVFALQGIRIFRNCLP